MAVTVEELEIKVTAQVQQALAGLDKVLAKLQQIASTAMPQVEKTAKATAAAVDKTSRAMGLNAKAAQNAQKSAAAAGGATERAFAAAQKKLAKTESELEAVNARLDQLRQDKRSSLPEGAPHQKETLDLLLGQDKEYQKLVQRSDALGDQWQQQNDEVLRQQELLKGLSDQSLAGLPDEEPKEMAENLDKATDATRRFSKESKKAEKSKSTFRKITSSIKNMFTVTAVLEAIRKSIQWMVAAAKTGLTNLAQHNAGFAATMDAAASKVLQLKNALGTALAPILQAVAPLFNFLVDAAISAANAIAAFVSKLTGKGTYIRAGKAVDSFADKLGGATQNAKELDKATNTLGLDELNLVSQPEEEKITGGGSGSGGTSTFEEVPINPETAAFVDEMLKKLDPTIQAFGRLGDQLKRLGEFAWQGLQDFYNAFLVPVGDWTLGEGIPRFVDALTQGLAAVDWQNINGSLLGLWEALAPFAIQIGEGLVWFWENALVPLGTWTMNEAVPTFLNLLAAAFEVLTPLMEAFQPLGQWLWDNILLPIGSWTGEIFIEAIYLVTDALTGISDWISEHQDGILIATGVVSGFLATWKLYQGITNTMEALHDIVPKIKDVKKFLTELTPKVIDAAASFFGSGWEVFILVGALALLAAGIVVLVQNWDKMTGFQQAATILAAIAAAATAAAVAIGIFHASWSLGIAAAAIAAGVALLAGVYLSVKDFNIPAPKVDEPEMPAMPAYQMPSVPQLATGAVLTRRTVFEGGEYPGAHDNPEIVSPRSMMVSAFREALAEQGGAGGNDIQQPVELSLDGDVFYRAMVRIKANRGATVSSTFAEAY